ncbi:MAG TPA: DUF2085 domain-containing protein [Pyrinomonadaceae bacterium]|nr:DUF2085 domain-containing protein [Pyrinomonadaceae bacterium]
MSETAAISFYRAVMWAGHFVCHQMPARSPHLFGAQLPLCWRCAGVVCGALAFVVWLFRARRLPALWPSVALALVMPLDVLQAVLTHGEGDNARRLLTGSLWGFFAASLALHFFTFISSRVSSRMPGAVAGRRAAAAARENFSPEVAGKLRAGAHEAT